MTDRDRKAPPAPMAGEPMGRGGGAQQETERAIGALLASARVDRFEAGFAGRVMRRVHEVRLSPAAALNAALARHFQRRLVPAALVAALGLALYSLVERRDAGESLVDALLGLPPATAEEAFDPVLMPPYLR
jgi:hypothetical protein